MIDLRQRQVVDDNPIHLELVSQPDEASICSKRRLHDNLIGRRIGEKRVVDDPIVAITILSAQEPMAPKQRFYAAADGPAHPGR